MSVQRTLQKYMDNWKRISHLDFCLLLEDNSVFVTTCEKRLPSAAKLDDFRQSTALCLANTTCCLYKITEKSDVPYLLVVWGSDASVSTIGELAVCQIQSILEGFSEKNDKNSSYSFNDGTRKCLVRKDGKRKWIIWTCWKTKVFTY